MLQSARTSKLQKGKPTLPNTYAVSQIVTLIQNNLQDERYYDVDPKLIENQVRRLVNETNPKRYNPVTPRATYSLDEDFKNLAIQTLTDFERTPKPRVR